MRPDFTKRKLAITLAAALFAVGSSVTLAQDADVVDDETEDEKAVLDTIVVVGSRTEQNIEDVAGSVSVMTGKDIEDQMVSDMSQLFKYEPGIEITGSNGTAQNFIVRGMGADRVMMIKDGMRMNEGYGADGANDVVGRGFIDMDCLKQVEVAKGAASSLYGADALGGIVAFATLDAGDMLAAADNFYVAGNGDYDGRSDEFGAGARTAFRVGSWESLVCYKGRWGHETQNYDETREDIDVESNSVLVKTDYIIDEDKKLTFSFDYYLEEVDRPDNGEDKGNWQGLNGYHINFEESYNEKENNSYQVRYRDRNAGLAILDNLDVNLYLNKSDQTDQFIQNHDVTDFATGEFVGTRDRIMSDLFQQETWGLSASASKILGTDRLTHQISYGLDWDTTDTFRPRSEVRIQNGETIKDDLSAPFPKNTTDRLGLYLQDTIQLTENWSLIPGVRYDDYKMTPKGDEGYDNVNPGEDNAAQKISDSNVSWRLGTLYKFTDDFSAYFQYSQGFKVPPYDLAYFYFDHVAFCDFSVFTCFGIRIIPADDLVPEESDSYEVGVRGSFGNFSYNLSAYRSDYDNFIQIAYLDSIDGSYFGFPLVTDVFQYQNIESAEISGIEFRFEYYMGGNVSLFLNGEWMDSEDKSTGDQLPSIQPFNGTVGMNWFSGNLSLDAMLKWASDMDKNPEGTFTTDDWITVDVYARYDFNDRLTLSAGVLNLFDEEYIQYSTIAGIPDNGRDLSSFTEPGRTFSARLKFVF